MVRAKPGREEQRACPACWFDPARGRTARLHDPPPGVRRIRFVKGAAHWIRRGTAPGATWANRQGFVPFDEPELHAKRLEGGTILAGRDSRGRAGKPNPVRLPKAEKPAHPNWFGSGSLYERVHPGSGTRRRCYEGVTGGEDPPADHRFHGRSLAGIRTAGFPDGCGWRPGIAAGEWFRKRGVGGRGTRVLLGGKGPIRVIALNCRKNPRGS